MRLYVVRHGDALSKAQDPTRPLSEEGRRQVEATAALAKRVGVKPVVIAHSDKLRARQTAHILAEVLDPPQGLRELADDLAPNADPESLRHLCCEEKGDKLVVGHLPHLGQAVTDLLAPGCDHSLIALAAACLVVLEETRGSWQLHAVVPPAFVA